MRSTRGEYHGHLVMIQAATQGTFPTKGPLSRRFKPGNAEYMKQGRI